MKDFTVRNEYMTLRYSDNSEQKPDMGRLA
jgi:hypothetical protein